MKCSRDDDYGDDDDDDVDDDTGMSDVKWEHLSVWKKEKNILFHRSSRTSKYQPQLAVNSLKRIFQ